MSEKTLAFLASAIQTFISSFLVVFGTTLANGHIQWSWSFFGAIAVTALRAGIKAVFQETSIPVLGGKK